MKKCLTSCLVLVSGVLLAQQQPLGTWKDHPSFSSIQLISGNQDVLFAASQHGLFSYRAGQTPNLIGQPQGLAATSITTMMYLPEENGLLIGYESGAIDFVGQQRINNERALTELDNRLDKALYDITVVGSRAYFASDLGVVEYNLAEKIARDVYRNIGESATPVSVYQLISSGQDLYAFSSSGLLRGSVTKNLLDFSQWETLDQVPYDQVTKAAILNDTVYYTSGDQELKRILLDGTGLSSLTFAQAINSLEDQGTRLVVTTQNQVWEVVGEDLSLLASEEGPLNTALLVGEELWLGTTLRGMVSYSSGIQLLPDGPTSDKPQHLTSVSQQLYTSSTGFATSLYENGTWTETENMVDVAILSEDTIFLTATGTLMNSNGSSIPLPPINGQPTDLLTANDRLWVAYDSSDQPLISSEDLSTWQAFSSGDLGVRSLAQLSSSLGGVLYGRDDRNRLVAFDPFDQRSRILDFNDGIEGELLDYVIDQDDQLFIASDAGLFTALDATFIFDGEELDNPFIGSGNLIATDHFTALAVDPGNRKWFATTDGLWLYDASLSRQIAYYSKENSPLASNNIFELYFQEANGLLWAVTAGGLSSFQTDAKAAQFFHEEVKIFPNPIALSRDENVIGISGITANAQIKITTLAGRFVAEIDGHGSMSSWNLRDSYGQLIDPGIYLFFSSDSEGRETYVGKLLVEP